MGFFDKVLSAANTAKDIMEDIQKVSNALGRETGQINKSTDSEKPKADYEAPKAAEEKFEPETVTIEEVTDISSREVSGGFFESGDNDEDIEYIFKFQLDNEYHQFDCGALEVDRCYALTAEIEDPDEEIDFDFESGTPTIIVSADGYSGAIVEQYKKKGTIPKGTTLQKVDHPLMRYRTTRIAVNSPWGLKDTCEVAYHFYRGNETRFYHQIGASYATEYIGTEMERKVLRVLDLAALTYAEEVEKTV